MKHSGIKIFQPLFLPRNLCYTIMQTHVFQREKGGRVDMAKVTAVVNQKGGVGKTTTTVNLTSAMGARRKKCLLVDIDPQGNATSGLGIDQAAGQSLHL